MICFLTQSVFHSGEEEEEEEGEMEEDDDDEEEEGGRDATQRRCRAYSTACA